MLTAGTITYVVQTTDTVLSVVIGLLKEMVVFFSLYFFYVPVRIRQKKKLLGTEQSPYMAKIFLSLQLIFLNELMWLNYYPRSAKLGTPMLC